MIEYYQRKAYGRHINASRSFLYKTTRKLGGFTGDSGAFLRTTIGAMAVFGVVPEQYWPYKIADFDKRARRRSGTRLAQSFQSLVYYRLAPAVRTAAPMVLKPDQVAPRVADAGHVPASRCSSPSTTAKQRGKIPLSREQRGRSVGGHAVMAVGYDDALKIQRTRSAPAQGDQGQRS